MPKKELAWGYTTGTCAQAATKAAMQMLMTGKEVTRTEVKLPNGTHLMLDIREILMIYPDDLPVCADVRKEGSENLISDVDTRERLPVSVSCAVQKYSGDDPDITNGILVYSKVEKTETGCIVLEGGTGVGRVTKPGLEQSVGQAAINRVPRQMILREAEDACEECGYSGGIRVEISIPEGEHLAKKTFNPRLGIEGGLSILGTSGRVEPMSEQALLDTIRLEMQVKLAEGREYLIAAPGNYGLDFLKNSYGIEEREVVKCSNYIGQTLDMASELGCKGLLLTGHIGKLIKVAGGIMNTHSRWADCRMELLAAAALRAGIPGEKACEFLDCVTTDDALAKCTPEDRAKIMTQVTRKIEQHLGYRAAGELPVEAVVFSNVYGILGKTSGAEAFLQRYLQSSTAMIVS